MKKPGDKQLTLERSTIRALNEKTDIQKAQSLRLESSPKAIHNILTRKKEA